MNLGSITKTMLTSAVAAVLATASHAALVSTNGSLSDQGVAAAIIAAPGDVTDDAAANQAIQAFDEVIGYTLLGALNVDGGSVGYAGLRVDSHMIFLNSRSTNTSGGCPGSPACIEHGAGQNQNAASFTFDGQILGVMSNSNGSLEVATSAFLGAVGTLYPNAPFSARGMEGGSPWTAGTSNDWYRVAGDTIRLGMRVTEPGDWIRVVTVSAVPVPASMLLMGTALVGFGGFAARRKRKS